MSEPRLLRTLAVPLGVALIFLVFTPKLCQRALVTAKARHAVSPTASQPESSGLIISSSTPAPVNPANLHYPAGLDPSRIQYLVEIDPSFAAPMTMAATIDSPVTKILLERQYIEKRPDGTFRPTREGFMNVNGAVDSSAGWIVPVAQRKFAGVLAVDDAGEGRYNVSVRWRWEPPALFVPLLPKPEDHDLVAEFAGGEGHWALRQLIKAPDRSFH